MTKRTKGARTQKSKRQRDQEKLLRLMKEDLGTSKIRKCPSGKRIFNDKVSALLAVAENQRKDKQWRAKTEKRAYECPDCHNYHVTSRETWGGTTYEPQHAVNDYTGNTRSQNTIPVAMRPNTPRFS